MLSQYRSRPVIFLRELILIVSNLVLHSVRGLLHHIVFNIRVWTVLEYVWKIHVNTVPTDNRYGNIDTLHINYCTRYLDYTVRLEFCCWCSGRLIGWMEKNGEKKFDWLDGSKEAVRMAMNGCRKLREGRGLVGWKREKRKKGDAWLQRRREINKAMIVCRKGRWLTRRKGCWSRRTFTPKQQ